MLLLVLATEVQKKKEDFWMSKLFVDGFCEIMFTLQSNHRIHYYSVSSSNQIILGIKPKLFEDQKFNTYVHTYQVHI